MSRRVTDRTGHPRIPRRPALLRALRQQAVEYDDAELALLLLHLERYDTAHAMEPCAVVHLDTARRLTELLRESMVSMLEQPVDDPRAIQADAQHLSTVMALAFGLTEELKRLSAKAMNDNGNRKKPRA